MLSQILHARRYNYAKTLISTNNKRLLTFCSMEASMSLKLGLRVGFSFQHRLMMLLNLPFGSMVSGCVAPCPTCQIRDWSGRVEKGCSRVTSSYTMVLRGGGKGKRSLWVREFNCATNQENAGNTKLYSPKSKHIARESRSLMQHGPLPLHPQLPDTLRRKVS